MDLPVFGIAIAQASLRECVGAETAEGRDVVLRRLFEGFKVFGRFKIPVYPFVGIAIAPLRLDGLGRAKISHRIIAVQRDLFYAHHCRKLRLLGTPCHSKEKNCATKRSNYVFTKDYKHHFPF